MNIRRGLHRIVILVISGICFAYIFNEMLINLEKYSDEFRQIQSIDSSKYKRAAPSGKAESIDWGTKYKYQEAHKAGHSHKEIADFLFENYDSFDWEKYEVVSQKSIKKQFFLDSLSALFDAFIFALTSYATVCVLYFCTRWIYRGFKKETKTVLK